MLPQPSLAHWLPIVHGWPGASRHCFAVAEMVPQMYFVAAQSVLWVHCVLHVVAVAHLKFPGQAPALEVLQAPLPSHVGAAVNDEPEQEGEPQTVPAG
jgi:hypothetical protein